MLAFHTAQSAGYTSEFMPVLGPPPLLADPSTPSTISPNFDITPEESDSISKLRQLLGLHPDGSCLRGARGQSSCGPQNCIGPSSSSSRCTIGENGSEIESKTRPNARVKSCERGEEADENPENAQRKKGITEKLHGQTHQAVDLRHVANGYHDQPVGPGTLKGSDPLGPLSAATATQDSMSYRSATHHNERPVNRSSNEEKTGSPASMCNNKPSIQSPAWSVEGPAPPCDPSSGSTKTDVEPTIPGSISPTSSRIDGVNQPQTRQPSKRLSGKLSKYQNDELEDFCPVSSVPRPIGEASSGYASTAPRREETGAWDETDNVPSIASSPSSQEIEEVSEGGKKSKGMRARIRSLKSGVRSLVSKSTPTTTTKDSTQRAMDAYQSTALTQFEKWWLDDRCLLRFLRARDMNVKKAFAMLVDTIGFRREVKPHLLSPKHVEHLNREGNLYRLGFDRDGRAVVMMWPTEDAVSGKDDEQIKNIIYHVERAIASMGVEPEIQMQDSIILIVNYSNLASSSQPSISATRTFLEIFSNHYPERLHKAFIVNAPWYFTTLWSVVSPLLPSRTKEKIEIIDPSNPYHIQKIHTQIDTSLLNVDLGGTGQYEYEHEPYWAKEAVNFQLYFDYMWNKFNHPSRCVCTNHSDIDLDRQESESDGKRTYVGG
eukprot:GHVN01092217.1.p1 GENE.GHVN01092217.1~~GHVN01092217.1.p1  ORF type:complete len:660 (+),score=84.50 GHVN01092217.1:196-2175(+)